MNSPVQVTLFGVGEEEPRVALIIHFTRLTSASSEQVDLNVLISTSEGVTEGGGRYIKDTLAKLVTPPAQEGIHSPLSCSTEEHLCSLGDAPTSSSLSLWRIWSCVSRGVFNDYMHDSTHI